ncbi:hypothetical protein LSTR_LSTR002753 [Laodelphax striatellus]|uniref:Phenylalanine--tRNA ligase, mitochondrial n=1 Tax=Laodelphax striatellus TaxID=195883 RepID=A0A482X754_LAOST|nr:hypothetical protein LSTR_LSTR002753 [Laodelphax striatellus]
MLFRCLNCRGKLQLLSQCRGYAEGIQGKPKLEPFVSINNVDYARDNYTNVTPKILSYLGRNLHREKYHPISFVKRRIENYFYKNFIGRRGNPMFSMHDNLNPVVSVESNFDNLLIPADHVSRQKGDCYYINKNYLLRAHTTAHQFDLIKMGLDHFIVTGDVYRRDEIDSTHFPVFHQSDAVRLFTREQLAAVAGHEIEPFELNGIENEEKQAQHTLEASKLIEKELKSTLLSLIFNIFGGEMPHRWVDVYFPFTHPSWELEIEHNGTWMEVLGCGVMRQDIIKRAGAGDRICWAFGMGLERLAMHLYKIPDIRLFWSKDSGFLSQFNVDDPNVNITYKPVSVYPQLTNDLSFWLPVDREYCSNDFYDLVRDIGGNIVEQINLVDEFRHPKTGKVSHCYRIVYRHMEKTLTQEEVNEVHFKLRQAVVDVLNGAVR